MNPFINKSVLLFFNLGGGEIFIVALVVILFFGSKKIPELMKGIGKGMKEFKDVTSNIKEEINKELK